jgi:hypothetical protein
MTSRTTSTTLTQLPGLDDDGVGQLETKPVRPGHEGADWADVRVRRRMMLMGFTGVTKASTSAFKRFPIPRSMGMSSAKKKIRIHHVVSRRDKGQLVYRLSDE